jgi:hypothetical protein
MRIWVTLLALLLSGCTTAGYIAATAITGFVAVTHVKGTEARKDFIAEFNRVNVEREAKGLKPLEWCTEVRRFDMRWAREECPRFCLER